LNVFRQILAGPAFILVFIFSDVFLAILSDWLYDKLSRTIMLAAGTATFSVACLLMGVASSYWQLVVLRMMIAAGLAVCR
jgi:MFS family permease